MRPMIAKRTILSVKNEQGRGTVKSQAGRSHKGQQQQQQQERQQQQQQQRQQKQNREKAKKKKREKEKGIQKAKLHLQGGRESARQGEFVVLVIAPVNQRAYKNKRKRWFRLLHQIKIPDRVTPRPRKSMQSHCTLSSTRHCSLRL